MDILFCDRCRESIPDADLDAGRAVRVGGKAYHVSCAFSRAMPGPGRTLAFLVAVLALGVATYAAVRASRSEPAARPAETADAARRAFATDLATLESKIETALGRQRTELEASVDAAVGRAREGIEAAEKTEIEKSAALLDGKVSGWADANVKRLEVTEAKVTELATWVKEVRDSRTRLQAAAKEPSGDAVPGGAAVAEAPTPPAGPVSPASPVPPPEDPEVRRRHDAEVAKWIEMLKDSNASISYSATFKLKELKDAKAVPALVEALKTNKDFWTRQGAASALGAIRSPDSVASLVDGLDDKEQIVFLAASDALIKITGRDFRFVPDPSPKERKTYRADWTKWWKENEAEVRRQLDAPAGSDAAPRAGTVTGGTPPAPNR